MDNPRIVTVLRTGGEYTPAHVARLRDQCARHAPGVPFLCISDDESVPGHVPMFHRWSRWWPKLEAFAIVGPVLYMDLDTTVVGSLTPLLKVAATHPFTALRDFNWPDRELQSSVMAWSGSMGRLRKAFEANPDKHMRECSTRRWHGDQGFIEQQVGNAFARWQDVLPGALVSFKKHVRPTGTVPRGASVVVFHGKPRPWDVPELEEAYG